MKTVPVHEAETRLSELLAAVELGEEITITRHGRPVARIVAVADASAVALTQRERVARTFARLRGLRQGVNSWCRLTRALGGSLREAIEGGRD
jgi:prevent-host-death family protein